MPEIHNIPSDSDILIAIGITKKFRDEAVDDFSERIKKGALEEEKEVLQFKLNELLKMNESIKLLEDAAVMVYVTKKNQ